jgi:sugar/nucleoside kinase (ribokinase family)
MPGEPVKTFQPFDVDVVDTTGGGDAFRAGIVYGYLRGWSPEKMVRFAAAVAGLVCTRFPGVLDAPTLDEVVRFMEGTGISG